MAETVDVPKIGNVNKTWVWAGVAVTGGIVGYAWWRNHQASKAAQTTTVDPATGSVGSTGYLNPAPVVANDSTNQPPAAPTTNQDWTSRVIADLGNIGLDAGFVSATIGKYLAGQKLTNDEADIVRQAWAFEGKPPGGPTNINLVSDNSTPGTPSTPPPPDLTIQHLAIIDSNAAGEITVNWDDNMAAEYYVITQDGGAFRDNAWGSAYTRRGLVPGSSHSFTVHAVGFDQKPGPESGSVTGVARK